MSLSAGAKVLSIIGDLRVWYSDVTKEIHNSHRQAEQVLLGSAQGRHMRHTLTWYSADTVEDPYTEMGLSGA
ncbi:hypothetical protein IFM47457_04455 [Aspergillus lentulus]|nr:hypothetical protein IFM47457_04455 [Aspergillus lentulus]